MDTRPTFEELADEMAELILYTGGRRKRWGELPRVIRRLLDLTPEPPEILHSELTAHGWFVKGFTEAECPEDLRRIIEQRVGLDEIDFGRDVLVVCSWEDPPGTWMHWPLSVTRPPSP